MFYQKKDLLEKAAIIKRFEYSPLGNELKKKTDIAEKLCKWLDKIKKKTTVKKYNRSNLVYDSKYNFYKYTNIKNVNSLSLELKLSNFKLVL